MCTNKKNTNPLLHSSKKDIKVRVLKRKRLDVSVDLDHPEKLKKGSVPVGGVTVKFRLKK